MSLVLIARTTQQRRIQREDRCMEFGYSDLLAPLWQISLRERYHQHNKEQIGRGQVIIAGFPFFNCNKRGDKAVYLEFAVGESRQEDGHGLSVEP